MTWLGGLLASFRELLAAAAVALGIAGTADAPLVLHGYVEGEYLHVAAPVAGTLQRLAVARGQQITAETPLFSLDLTTATAERDRLAAELAQARSRLEDLRKGKRAEEREVIAAQKVQAEAMMRLSEVQLRRQEVLAERNVTSRDRLDEARATFERDRARVEELSSQLAVARLPAREDEIRAAEAAVTMAKAALAQAERRLVELAPPAPVDALVEDTLFNPGEWVPAGAPIVSLLPPGQVKLRFFVPEDRLGAVALGQQVRFRCDGCAAGLVARVSYVAPRAEYTPPVVYSVGRREKLVFLVEARPESGAASLHPGQPVDVELGG